MFKKLWNFNVLYLVLLSFSAVQTIALYFWATEIVFYISLALFIVLSIVTVFRIFTVNKKVNGLIGSINDDIENSASNALTSFNLPVLIVSFSNEIIWYNNCFSEKIKSDADSLIGKDLSEILGKDSLDELLDKGIASIAFENKIFDIYVNEHSVDNSIQRILCFIDLTELRKIASEHKLSRPAVAFIAVDNLEDLTHNMRDSERNKVSSKIQTVLEDWFSTVNGINYKISGERYIFIFEERELSFFVSSKFDVLNRIRSIELGENRKATISIGVGQGANFKEAEEHSAQALDMALGRGGDQVAIKRRDNSFQFFGGHTKSNEKRTRVRTRIVASTLIELINSSDQVILMGHKFADLDCYGSAFALCSAIRKHTDTPAIIAMEKKSSLVQPLFNRISDLGSELMISDYNSIAPTITKNSLLIILDTHRPPLLEYPALIDEVGTIVVIDHHRKAVDYIANAVIFYHETAASSTSEMVCELLQYISEKSVGRAEAEALLSGIVLDTRNYCMNTGMRTFEASAFLRRKGADPIAVKKFFADSLDNHKIKSLVVATAEQFGEYAIAINNNLELSVEQMRILSSQSADELLNISGIKASFVIFKVSDEINISARSYGAVNVQLIMEKLGGGGHSTMAACQLSENDYVCAKNKLLEAIKLFEEEK